MTTLSSHITRVAVVVNIEGCGGGDGGGDGGKQKQSGSGMKWSLYFQM